jgi:hypothetical protein
MRRSDDASKLQECGQAPAIYLVLAGHGTVTASASGQPARVIKVNGTPNSHTLLSSSGQHSGPGAAIRAGPAPGRGAPE